jgi:hypothetical protein
MRKSPLNDFTSFLIECLNRALYHDTDRQGVSGTFQQDAVMTNDDVVK